MTSSAGRLLSAFGVLSFLLVAQAASAQTAPAQPATPKDDSWESPAKAADPPLIPSPSAGSATPLSTSGTDVTPSSPSSPPTSIGADGGPSATSPDIRELNARLESTERRLHRLEDKFRPFRHITLSAYAQPQLLVQSYNAAASPNAQNGLLPPGISSNDVTARPDGSTTNGTMFRLRRTRLRTTYETESMRLFLQIDALPAGGIGPGIGTIIRNAEVTGIARWTRDIRTEVTAGLFFTPFRAELLEPSNVRPFIERTWFVQNVFPLERDIGVHARTLAFSDHLIVDLAVVNGQRLGERYFVQMPDLNKPKDLVGLLTYQTGPLVLGVNGYVGTGQIVDAQLLRFKEYTKWAVNYQATLKARVLRMGQSRLYGELAITRNMDTGIFYPFAVPQIPADFNSSATSLDGRAFFVRAEQDIGHHFVVGYRWDAYSPNTAIDNNSRNTHAFLAAVKFNENLRWMNEFDYAIDNVHAENTPAPSKHILAFSSVLQASF